MKRRMKAITFVFFCLEALSTSALGQTPRLVAQTGYPIGITDLSFSPDGKMLAGAGGIVKLWDVASGQELRTFTGITARAQGLTFSPDGATLATGSLGDGIIVWEAATGKVLQKLSDGWILGLAFSRDSKTLAAQDDKRLELWNLTTGQRTRAINGNANWVLMAFTPDRKTLIDEEKDGLHVRDAATGELIRTFVNSGGKISALGLTSDGTTLATASEENYLRLWDVATGTEIRSIKGFTDNVQIMALRPDGKVLAAIEGKSTIKVIDTVSGKLIRTLHSDSQELYSIAFSPDNQTLAAGGKQGISLWNVTTGQSLRTLEGHSDKTTTVRISPNGQFMGIGTESGTIKLVNLAGKEVRSLKGHTGQVMSVAFNSDSTILASGSLDNTVKLWNTATGKEIRSLKGHTERVFAVAFSPDGSLASGSYDLTVKLWNPNTGAEIRTFVGKKDGLGGTNSIDFSPDGKLMASVSQGEALNKAITLWNVASGQEIRKFPGHIGDITSVVFFPSGQLLMSRGMEDPNLRFWDINTGQQVQQLAGTGGLVKDIAISADGRFMANGVYRQGGGSVQIWDMGAGHVKETVSVDNPSSISFSPRGEVLAIATNADVRLVSTQDGQEQARIFTFSDDTWAAVDPIGRYDGSSGGSVPSLHWALDNESIGLDQLKERYYEPGLLAKILGFSKEPLRDVAVFNNVALYPEANLAAVPGKPCNFDVQLTNRGGGIGRVAVWVNGKEMATDARGGSRDATAQKLTLPLDVSKSPFLKAGEQNTVEIRAFNNEGYLASRNVQAVCNAPGDAPLTRPSFWGIVAGISEYAGPDIRLQYSGKDAVDMARALRTGANRLFGPERTHITLLTTAAVPGALLPTRENLQKAFTAAQQARPSDVLVVYLAGHGVNYGGPDGDYYYLTQEARTGDLTDPEIRLHTAVSSLELTEWIKQIPALKQTLLLDTCGAGRLVQKLTEKRDISSSQIRSLERMKDRTGLFILAGSAADAVSYETSEYAQGLLTYSLLLGMKGAALREGSYVDVSKWFEFAADEVPRLAKDIGGIQRPVPAVPNGGASFDLGQLLSADKLLIPLSSVRPVFLVSSFQDEVQLRDHLKLTGLVNEGLREASSSGSDPSVVYVEASDFPGAYAISGLYRVAGVSVTAKIAVFRGEKAVGNFGLTGETSAMEKLARDIVNRAVALTHGSP